MGGNKMSDTERQALLAQIEAAQQKMYDAVTDFNLTATDVVRASQELDLLIVQYIRATA